MGVDLVVSQGIVLTQSVRRLALWNLAQGVALEERVVPSINAHYFT